MSSPLPLPVSVLLARAHNAKSPKDRHDTAYFAWEVSIRLSVAARPPARVLRLARASVGVWVGALSLRDRALAVPALLATFSLFLEVGQNRRASPRSVTASKLLDALPAYRNRVIGHGSARRAAFYDDSAGTLIEGLNAAWEEAVFLPKGSDLVYAESVELDPEGTRRARLLSLMGPIGRVLDSRGTAGVPESMLPHRLYLKQRDTYRSLHPWALFRAEDFRERIFFFNGIGRRAEVLDYASGDLLKGMDLETAFPSVEAAIFDVFSKTRETGDDTPSDDPNRFGGFRLLGQLGEGGMGVVYLAEQVSLGRLVALKLLPTRLAEDAVALARFKREVAALSRCDHPHVVKILASGEAHGVPYYAMEYVEGSDLSRVAKELPGSEGFDAAVSTASEQLREERKELFANLQAESAASPRQARSVDRYRQMAEAMRDAARGMQHLHDAGIVHRDVKPANLMVTAADHRVVVMDLGLAMVSDASHTITRDKSHILGTLRYMPCEQLLRNLRQVDYRADIYSLGATFYELLTGKPFFDGDTEERLIKQVLDEKPVPAEKANPKVPQDLATIIGQATEKDPKLRYESADALADDIDAFLGGQPISARPPTLWYLLRLAMRRQKALVGILAATSMLMVVGTAVFMFNLDAAKRRAEDALDEKVAALGEVRRERDGKAKALAQVEVERDRATYQAGLYLREQGRVELVSGSALKALVYLRHAFERIPRDPVVGFLLGRALRMDRGRGPVLGGHWRMVMTAAFSHDGRRVVTASWDGTARVFDAGTGKTLAVLKEPTAGGIFHTAAFSPDDSLVVATGGGEAHVFNSSSGKMLAVLRGRGGKVRTAAFSPDGSRVVIAEGVPGHARVFDVATGSVLADLEADWDTAYAAAFGPDGNRVVTGSGDGVARIFDAATGRVLATLKGHTKRVNTAKFSDNGKRVVTASDDATSRVFDADTGEVLVVLQGHKGKVQTAAFDSSALSVVTASHDHTARIFDAKTGSLRSVLKGHVGWVYTAMFSPDDKLVVTASADKTARVFGVDGGKTLAVLEGHEDRVVSASFSPDGRRIVTSSFDDTARIFDVAMYGPAARLEDQWVRKGDATFSADGNRVVTASDDKTGRVFDAATGKLLLSLEGHALASCAFSPDGSQIVAGSSDNTARIFDAVTGKVRAVLGGHRQPVKSVAFSSDGTRIVTRSYDRFRVFDAASGEQLAVPWVHAGSVRAAKFSPDGSRVVTAGGDKTAWIIDIATRKALFVLKGHGSVVLSAAYSFDGRRIVTASEDKTARVFDATTGELVVVLVGHEDHVRSAAFSPDGRLVLTASSDGTARIFGADSGNVLAVLKGYEGSEGPVNTAMFSPDGALVLTRTESGPARVFDAATAKLLGVLLWEGLNYRSAEAAAFSDNGRRILTFGGRGPDYIWDVAPYDGTPAQLAGLVEERVPFVMSEAGVVVFRSLLKPVK